VVERSKEAQRADAATYSRSGQLSTDLKASLLSAGLLQSDQQQPSSSPAAAQPEARVEG